MTKQILKLTENDLHNIIKESVNKILSELNWKTYDRASKQDYNSKRAEKFADRRNDVFNSEFGYDDYKSGNHIRMQSNCKNEPRLDILTNNNSKDKTFYYLHPDEKRYAFTKNYTSGYEEYPNANSDKIFARRLAKAHDEFKNINAEYKDGSYQDNQLNTGFHKFLGKK
jgi:hypothetical protein